MSVTSPYRRVLLKLSGEALAGGQGFGIDPAALSRFAREIAECLALGVQLALVVGGGNIFRGAALAESGLDRVSADHMGMLATVINALALQDALEHIGVYVRVMSAVRVNQVCEDYIRRRAVRHLEKNRVVICAAGTGNPFFTTDSAASLRAVEIGADVLLKATQVDGVYSADPRRDATAERYTEISYDEVLTQRLAVMDATAIVLCRDHNIPIVVFDINEPGTLARVVAGAPLGTRVRSAVG